MLACASMRIVRAGAFLVLFNYNSGRKKSPRGCSLGIGFEGN